MPEIACPGSAEDHYVPDVSGGMCIDSAVDHGFGFTPAISLFVQCDSEDELDGLYGELAEQGQALMPLGSYGFSAKFGWANDRFGVSWQLNLPGAPDTTA
jgi:predicted 3-demethylubiquinone-9 3-methyltransferase (glyoxalase superfamily)